MIERLPIRGSAEYLGVVRRHATADSILSEAAAVLAQVRDRGDEAVRELTLRFDGVHIVESRVEAAAINRAVSDTEPRLLEAFQQAAENIRSVHAAQRFSEEEVRVAGGVRVWRVWRPLQRVGIYVPGGLAPYPSSVLMMGIPARLAGCTEVVLCSPPRKDGTVDRHVLAAAAIAGIAEVHAVGGVQAIGAMAYGTDSLRRVDKIFGPGNAYVTAAKRLLFGEVAIDMPAGPSEVVVVTDGSVPADWLAADLEAQAEHAPDAVAVLVSTDWELAAAVAGSIAPNLASQVRIFTTTGLDAAIAFSNDFAPEHLILACREPEHLIASVLHAGSVFLGSHAPAAVGDYATGANHVIPTDGMARSFSALGLDAFGHTLQVQSLTAAGLARIAPIAREISAVEGFKNHWKSIEVRLGVAGP